MLPVWENMAHAPALAPAVLVGLVGMLMWRLHRLRDHWRRRERIARRLASH